MPAVLFSNVARPDELVCPGQVGDLGALAQRTPAAGPVLIGIRRAFRGLENALALPWREERRRSQPDAR